MTKLDIRRVIDGKVYDTATAEEVMRFPRKVHGGDDKWEDTRMYRSPKGKWFIAGEGKALSRWGDREGEYYLPGEGIELLSDQEAQALMEKHDGPVEVYFEVEEG